MENQDWVYSISACKKELQFPNVVINNNSLANNVLRIIECFKETGSVNHPPRSERPCRVKEEVEESVRNIVHNEQTISLRRLTKQLNVSIGTCHKIISEDLEIHPYKHHMLQELIPIDYIVIGLTNI